jgi:hypothetical protein
MIGNEWLHLQYNHSSQQHRNNENSDKKNIQQG